MARYSYVFLISTGVIIILILLFCCNLQRRRRRYQSQRRPAQHSMIYSVTMQGNSGRSFHQALSEYLSGQYQIYAPGTVARELSSGQIIQHKPTGPPSYEEVLSSTNTNREGQPPPYSEVVSNTNQ